MANIWEKYEKISILGESENGKIYKVKNKKTKNYEAIKEIREDNNIDNILKNNLQSENIISYTGIRKINGIQYIIMELCIMNLEDYLKIKKKGLSIEETKEILNQLNNVFKEMKNKKVIHTNIKATNILFTFKTINNLIVKISDFGLNLLNRGNQNEFLYSRAPEIILGKPYECKSDIWSLGIIIYYMLFNEYPFNNNQEILNGKKLKLINNLQLNDLLSKMLVIEPENRITWDGYFSHPFFKIEDESKKMKENEKEKGKDNEKELNFDFICKNHNAIIWGYCEKCRENICELCLEKHPSNLHKIIPFCSVGFKKKEIEEIEPLINNIDKNWIKLHSSRNKMIGIYENLKTNKDNLNIYQFDGKNDFKTHYIKCLKDVEEKYNVVCDFPIDLNNYIICEHVIKNNNLKVQTQILNYTKENQNEIKNYCDIYINNKKIDFSVTHIFEKEGNYTVKIRFKKNINNLSWLFNNCSTITFIDFSNFNYNYITNLSWMFHGCSSLTTLKLSNLNTKHVIDMSGIFSDCTSLKQIDLSNFDTRNVKYMNWMFQNCSSLTQIDFSNFDTRNVCHMMGMFQFCLSLKTLDLSNFNTCNVTHINKIFADCSSLIFLNIMNFSLNFCYNTEDMFYNLNEKCKVIQYDQKIEEMLEIN